MPNIIKCFFDIKKGGYYKLSPVKVLYYGLGQPKEVVISRLSSSEAWLMLINKSYVFEVRSQPFFNDPFDCFIIELIRLMGL